ncbi:MULTISPECIES: hypothetical protein [unclassified Salinibacterium]|uniref:hypothetical protein n=1 Tax=unclassified Salinibacterium TaxID=2632331 RepID=UPI0018CDFA36|nr:MULTISPECIES: hypothetical protein [unclassified Salinibacterium]MBH0053130.1 hypothetical protein [Salinibacterium sp. SWN139]MBH0082396.1 hypothetical protein [Salinibacterium sp. SWN167]
MGKLVLTKSSLLVCSHPTPGVGIANNGLASSLIVGGSPALLVGDLVGASVAGCTQATSNTTKPCTIVVTVAAGSAATKLTVGGLAVLFDSAAGITDGLPVVVPPATNFSVSDAKQSKLRTV